MQAATRQFRADIAALVREAHLDLRTLFRGAETPDAAAPHLFDSLPGLVDAYGSAAATVAADWYDNLRDERGIPGSFTAIPADIADPGSQALVGWAVQTAADFAAFQSLIDGGTQRRIANFARQTITGSSIKDPKAHGWERVGAGNCDFCRMLIGGGAVYSEATASFESHDHCQCTAEPAW